jgi:hypothetical protein
MGTGALLIDRSYQLGGTAWQELELGNGDTREITCDAVTCRACRAFVKFGRR